jgi:hypothetical protein
MLLFWYYKTVITHSVSKRIFMMTGHQRKLMWLGVGEAVTYFSVSIDSCPFVVSKTITHRFDAALHGFCA